MSCSREIAGSLENCKAECIALCASLFPHDQRLQLLYRDRLLCEAAVKLKWNTTSTTPSTATSSSSSSSSSSTSSTAPRLASIQEASGVRLYADNLRPSCRLLGRPLAASSSAGSVTSSRASNTLLSQEQADELDERWARIAVLTSEHPAVSLPECNRTLTAARAPCIDPCLSFEFVCLQPDASEPRSNTLVVQHRTPVLSSPLVVSDVDGAVVVSWPAPLLGCEPGPFNLSLILTSTDSGRQCIFTQSNM
jgi:hypothetical protein